MALALALVAMTLMIGDAAAQEDCAPTPKPGGGQIYDCNVDGQVNSFNSGDGNDEIHLRAGQISLVEGDGGDDMITLDGATVTGSIIAGVGADTVILRSGSAVQVYGDDFGVDDEGDADTITLDGATVSRELSAGGGADTIRLFSGEVAFASGDAGDDTITVDGDVVIGGNIQGGQDDDVITLERGIARNIHGGAGHDMIILNAGRAGLIVSDGPGSGDDTIIVRAAEVAGILAGDGADTITLDHGMALVRGTFLAGSGSDTITLNGGMADSVSAGSGDDTITLDGATVTGAIRAGGGTDTIRLFSGEVASVRGDAGDDTITLDGDVVVGGNIIGGLDDDVITLKRGSAQDINGGSGDDSITLEGGSAEDINSGADDDVITLEQGSVQDINGGTGDDRVELSGTTVTGRIDGGDGVDILLVEAPATLAGGDVTNWERIRVRRAWLGLTGTLMLREVDGSGTPAEVVVGDQDGSEVTESLREGITLVGATLELLGPSVGIQGNVVVDEGSTLLAATPDGAGEFALRPRATGERSRLWLDGTLDLSGADPAAGDRFTFEDRVDLGGSARFVVDADLHGTEIRTDSLVFEGGSRTPLGGPATLAVNLVDGLPSSFIGRGEQCIPLPDILVGLEGGPVPLDPVLRLEGEEGAQTIRGPFILTVTVAFGDAEQGQEPGDVYLKIFGAVLPQVHGYSVLAELMRDDLPTLRDRLKDRRRVGAGDPGPEQATAGKASSWARIAGDRREIEHDGGLETGEWSAGRATAEFGVDFPMDLPAGPGTLGLSAHATRGDADARPGLATHPGTASIDATGYGAGASITLFPSGGGYVDAQGRVTFWDAEVGSVAHGPRQETDAFGWGASLETGRRLELRPDMAVVPRGRLVYTDVDLDGFAGQGGAEVRQGESASLVVEGGVTVERTLPAGGAVVSADVSLEHDVLQDSSIHVSGRRFSSGLDDTWAWAQLGLSGEAAPGVSAYLAVDVGSPLGDGFGGSWGYGARLGARASF